MSTFTISAKTQLLQHVAEGDTYRPNISGVYLNGKAVVATNGHAIVARKKSEFDSLDNSIVKFDKPKQKKQPRPFEQYAQVNGPEHASASGGAEIVDGQFPDWPQVIPMGAPVVRIALDPALLADIVAAMGNPGSICLEIRETTGPVVVTSDSDRDVAALLMPMKQRHNGEDCFGDGVALLNRLAGK